MVPRSDTRLHPPDTTDAERLFRHVYRDGAAYLGLASCRFVPGTKAKDGPNAWKEQSAYAYPQALCFALDRAGDLDAKGLDTYLSAQLHTVKNRKAETAADLWCLYNDTDAGSVPDWLRPTARVESSPGRFQDFWALTRPVPPAQALDLGRRIAAACGTDASGIGLEQVLRVPGTHNRSHPGEHVVRLLWLDDGRAYDPDDLDRLLPAAKATASAPPVEPADAGDAPPVRLDAYGLDVWQGKRPKRGRDGSIDRSSSLYKLGAELLAAGLAPRLLAGELAERDQSLGWEKYTGRAGAAAQYQAIVEKLLRATGTAPTPIRPDVPVQAPSASAGSPCASVEQERDYWRARAEKAEAERDRLIEERTAYMQVRQNPTVRRVGNTALAATFDYAQRKAAGAADADGWVHVWPIAIAESAGSTATKPKGKAESASRDLDVLQAMGFLEKRVKTTFVTVDEDTGEEVNDYRSATFIRIPGDSTVEQLKRLAAIEPAPPKPDAESKAKQWGGAREPGAKAWCDRCGKLVKLALHAVGDCGHDFGPLPADVVPETVWAEAAAVADGVNRQDDDSLDAESATSPTVVTRTIGRHLDDSLDAPSVLDEARARAARLYEPLSADDQAQFRRLYAAGRVNRQDDASISPSCTDCGGPVPGPTWARCGPCLNRIAPAYAAAGGAR